MFIICAIILVVSLGAGIHDASHCVEWEEVSTCFWGVAWFDWCVVKDAEFVFGFASYSIFIVLAHCNNQFFIAELKFVSTSSWFGA